MEHLNNKELTALGKYVVTLSKMLLPKLKLSVVWLPDGSNDLGYTYRKEGVASIHLNRGTHPIFDGLEKKEAITMITGVAIHELLHQLLTNFVMCEKITMSLMEVKKELFHTFFNIFEDSRIESFSPAYFGPVGLSSLEYSIQTIWDKSSEIEGEETPTYVQVLNALIQYGDIGLVKPQMSTEAEEIFNKIVPLFNSAIDSTSCTTCLLRAKEAMEILYPFIPEEYKDETCKGSSDSEGEDADASGKSGSKSSAKKRRRKDLEKRIRKESSESSEDDSEDLDSSSDKGKKDSESAGSSMDGSTGTEESETHGGGEGVGEEAGGGEEIFDGEVFEEDGSTEEEIAAAAKALEEEIKRISEEAAKEEAEKTSDFDFVATESGCKGDKWVKTISHHKAASVPDSYEKLKEAVASDAHELAKLINRQFKTKSGGKRRSDHGDLNLMRYKDPNFNSPRIFDKKNPKEKHSVAVMLLVDESGSMHGSCITNAKIATAMLAEAMAEVSIPCCIVGHSGDSKYSCSVELEHYTTFKNTPADRESIPMIAARCQNRDGPAIRWATSQLKKRPERKKLLIVISDGQPCADGYYGQDAIFDTKSAIRDAKRNHDTVGLVLEAGYSTDILHEMYGEDFVECDKASLLKERIIKIISQKCKTW